MTVTYLLCVYECMPAHVIALHMAYTCTYVCMYVCMYVRMYVPGRSRSAGVIHRSWIGMCVCVNFGIHDSSD